ncbi:Dynamin GTPase [Handroanthus impetiginosus]|uniref:Dynamin GTPase n=1 Tax=Handroanthus impetiginosus TaxID=429701 RepID=A0A2G9H6V1_9LAMI|nr:Dynamin GTPase [Handroanthus impetiginosus]
MKSPKIFLALMARKWCLFLLTILFSTSKSESQTNNPQAGLLCISDCETCPVICSPPPSSSSPSTPSSPLPPPPSPLPFLLPPPPVHHHSPPHPYYFASPPSTSPPAHPPPSPRSGGSGVATPPPPSPPQSIIPWSGAFPTPPSVYGYNPGNMGQRNFSYPYYYFYASKASCYLPFHQAPILSVVFIFFQVLF